jgi:hypothetical protein
LQPRHQQLAVGLALRERGARANRKMVVNGESPAGDDRLETRPAPFRPSLLPVAAEREVLEPAG